MSAAPQETSRPRRAANPRSPAGVLADVDEMLELLGDIRTRYVHAHDLAYSSGGGSNFEAGGSRGDLAESDPTGEAATAAGKEGIRHDVARAGREVGQAVKRLRWSHSALLNAVPLSRSKMPTDGTWKASSKDSLVDDRELAETVRKQNDRIRRGEL